MRLHTSLTYSEVWSALEEARKQGLVTDDVTFMPSLSEHGSRTHVRAFDVQLGTYRKDSLPAGTTDQHGRKMNVRRFRNRGDSGAESGWYEPAVWAATWYEWGWFMAAVFALDPGARFGSAKGWHYAGTADLNAKTDNAFAGFQLQGGVTVLGRQLDALRQSARDAYENGEIDDAWRDDLLRRIAFMEKQEEGSA